MIDYIRGKLTTKMPTYITIDVNGVGYGLHIPLSTYTQLCEIENSLEIWTYLYVREDTMRLYGFAAMEEKELFETLLSVSGVGPRMALGILSSLSVREFRRAVNNEDVSLLTTVPGIGKKKGERLLLELKDKIEPVVPEAVPEEAAETAEGQLMKDGMSALMSLGCKVPEAARAMRSARKVLPEGCALEELVREALKQL